MKIDKPSISQIPQLRSLWKDAFGDTDAFLDTFFQSAFDVNRCRCVTVDETIVAMLYWFECEFQNKPIAYIYAVATAKNHRGNGYCHQLLENTHQHLLALGYIGTILVPGSDELFRFYEGLGYKTCSQITEFHCKASAENIPLRRIDKGEYQILRREFLPENGVIQEKENLDFLQTQADFFAGEDFLLTLCKQENSNSARAIELLGNYALAPNILYSLGYTKGIFRIPGKETPFAMYHSLSENKLLPSYFAFAFD